MITYLESMQTGHPFTKHEVKTYFDSKKVFQRWRDIDGLKKLSTFRKKSKNEAPPELISHMPSLKKQGIPSIAEIVISLPEYRLAIFLNWRISWEEYISPELVIFNRYCMKYHNMPFYSQDKPHFCELEIPNIELDEFDPLYTIGSVLIDNFSNNDNFEVEGLFVSCINRLKSHPDDIEVHRVIWALSTCLGSSLLIQYLLHLNPEHIKYYSFIDWRKKVSGERHKLSLITLPADETYDPNYNIFNVHTDAAQILRIKTGLAFVSDSLIKYEIKSKSSSKADYESSTVAELTHIISEVKANIDNVNDYIETLSIPYLKSCITLIDEKIATTKELVLRANESIEQLNANLLGTNTTDNINKIKDNISKADNVSTDFLSTIDPDKIKSVFNDIDTKIINSLDEIVSDLDVYKDLSKDPIANKNDILAFLDNYPLKLDALRKIIYECGDSIDFFIKHILDGVVDAVTLRPNDVIALKEASIVTEGVSSDVTDKCTELESEVAALKLEKEQLKAEIKEVKAKIILLPSTEIATDERNGGLIDALECHIIDTLTPLCVLNILSEAYDELVVLPSAIKSAEEQCNFKQTKKMYCYLKTLVLKYYADIQAGKPDTEARKHFGVKGYAANESKSVSSNAQLMRHRTFDYNGQKLVMEQHLVIGVAHNQNETMRIYFKVLNDKVIIGYAGRHLPTKT